MFLVRIRIKEIGAMASSISNGDGKVIEEQLETVKVELSTLIDKVSE